MKRTVGVSTHLNLQTQQPVYELRVVDYPRRWLFVEKMWLGLCWLTRGWAGGHGMPEWGWKIPVGRAKWDRDDPDGSWLENSLARKLMDLENWFLDLADKRRVVVAEVEVDRETADRISPGFAAMSDELDEDNEKAGGDGGS